MIGGRAQKKRDRNAIIIGGLSCLIVLIIIGVVAVYLSTRSDTALNSKNLCPMSGPTGHLVLLVDKTDPLTFTQRTAFSQFMDELPLRVEKGELLSVFALGEDYRSTPEPVFEMCNPGSGDDASEWTSNPEKLKKRYIQKFKTPLSLVSEVLTSDKPAQHSPLMEMLQMVAINAFRKNNVGTNRRLLVVSDMLHNTPEFTLYKQPQDYNKFKDSLYSQKVRTDLGGVMVELYYLMNSPRYQKNENILFWERFFKSINASITSIKTFEG